MDTPDISAPAEDPAIRQFREAVSAGAPAELEVVAIPNGFDVVYREELVQHGNLMRIESTFRGVVACEPAQRTFSIEDRGIVAHHHLASLRMSVSGFRGRQLARRTVKVVGKLDDGTWGDAGTQSQDTREIHTAIRGPAAALGWTETQPTSAKAGRVVAFVVGGGLLLAGAAVSVLAIAGVFP